MQNLIAADFKSKLATAGTAQLLDVRTPEEYAAGKINGARNCDVFDPNFLGNAVQGLDKALPVFVYCRSGGRSSSAGAMLSAQGYEVVNLIGGYTAWEVLGY